LVKDITVLYNNREFVKFGFISGLLKTAQLESKKITSRTIGVDSLSIKTIETLVDILNKENQSEYADIRYKGDKREEKYFKPITSFEPSHIKIEEGGVYLITGGAGGLGFIFAEHICKTKDTKLILTGRSELSKEKEERLKRIPNAEYISCDVTDEKSVTKVIKQSLKTYGKLNGIIHSAGVKRDGLIVFKNEIEVEEVLKAKVLGTKYLDKATKNIDLDFFMLFSSMAGALGNPGQADYASGNAYLDNFSKYRNQLKEEGKRKGYSYSINWPLWMDGGMHPSKKTIDNMFAQFGLKPLPTEEGISVFESILQNKIAGNLVLFGQNIQKLEKLFLYEKPEEKTIEHFIEELGANMSVDSIDDLIQKIPEEFVEDLITVFTEENQFSDQKFDKDIEKMVDSLLAMGSPESIDAILDQLPEDAIQELISIITNF